MTYATDIQIKTAYDQGMSPEEIAEELGFDVTAVKAKLAAVSKEFRVACGQELEDDHKLNFTDQQLVDANEVIYRTMMHTEDERLKTDLAKYIRNDKKGRLDAMKKLAAQPQFNILQFNNMLQQVRQMRQIGEGQEKQQLTLVEG